MNSTKRVPKTLTTPETETKNVQNLNYNFEDIQNEIEEQAINNKLIDKQLFMKNIEEIKKEVVDGEFAIKLEKEVEDNEIIETPTFNLTEEIDFANLVVMKDGITYFRCLVCLREFSNKSNLNRHILTHSGKKPYSCTHCEKKFSRKSTLDEHLTIHFGEQPFQCTICKKAFCRKNDLKRHILQHNVEKPYKCNLCEKSYCQKCDLNRHMLIHSGEKRFKCDTCKYGCITRSDFKKHMLIHSGEKPFKCLECDKGFTSRYHLKIHLSRNHKEINEESVEEDSKNIDKIDNI